MGRTKEACDKFAESQKLDPHIGTLLNLAHCSEDLGLLLEAERYWRAAESLSKQTGDDRGAEARERLASLEPRIPTLTVRLADDAPAGASVELVRVDGGPPVVLGPNELGRPRRANPGDYRVVVKAPGREDRTYEVRLEEGTATPIAVNAAAGATERAVASGASDVGAAEETGAAPPALGWTVAGGVALGLGLVGLGVGAAFAGVASSKNAQSNEADDTGVAPCDGDGYCNQEGLDLRAEAIDAATASTVLFVVGGIVAAGGLAFLIFAPGDETEAGAVAELRGSVVPGGLALGGRF